MPGLLHSRHSVMISHIVILRNCLHNMIISQIVILFLITKLQVRPSHSLAVHSHACERSEKLNKIPSSENVAVHSTVWRYWPVAHSLWVAVNQGWHSVCHPRLIRWSNCHIEHLQACNDLQMKDLILFRWSCCKLYRLPRSRGVTICDSSLLYPSDWRPAIARHLKSNRARSDMSLKRHLGLQDDEGNIIYQEHQHTGTAWWKNFRQKLCIITWLLLDNEGPPPLLAPTFLRSALCFVLWTASDPWFRP